MASNVLLGLSMPVNSIHENGTTTSLMQAMQRWEGKRPPIYNDFITFWEDSANNRGVAHTFLANRAKAIWDKNYVPMITWGGWVYGEVGRLNREICEGKHNDFFERSADELKRWLDGGPKDAPRRLYIRLNHEMNMGHYPWHQTSGQYCEAWRRIWSAFDSRGITRDQLQWVWCPGDADGQGQTKAEYYPGHQYVDWLGIDAYNWGMDNFWGEHNLWRTPADLLSDKLIQSVASIAPNKPLGIMEISTTTSKGARQARDVAAKAQWLTELYAVAKKHPKIQMVCLFNLDKPEHPPGYDIDWAVFGHKNGTGTFEGHQVYDAYRQAIAAPEFVGSPGKHPILSAAQFKGGGGASKPVDKPVDKPVQPDPGNPGAGGNLVVNGKFDADNAYTRTPKGWLVWSPNGHEDASFAETHGGARSGSFHGTHYKPGPYEVYTYQVIKGVANGVYTLEAWVRATVGEGGVFTKPYLEAKDFGGANMQARIDPSQGWTRAAIAGINVTAGQITVGLYSKGGAKQALHFDDISLTRSGGPAVGGGGGGALATGGWQLSASSSAGGEPPAHAIDGRPETRWSSGELQGARPNQWFTIDMRARQSFNRVVLDAGASGNDYPRQYILKGSNDAQNWTEIVKGAGTGPVTTISCPRQTWQYIGIAQVGSAPFWWSIHDLKVYG